ncbi:hypothetical protein M407DRAFT_246071 [Tulasnella calospora MUT 4182]|uniref:Uncharacterized protein n=1 Tax=Tulasnella calospora MUT 4182 TaxID=1051891 RepID=A0A0C3KE43_9AGAM|nr:hypothetical protein M407DRAFT_246071 [Tulasnella calospora MUT 4182]
MLAAKPYQSFQPAYSDWRTSSLRSTTGEEQRPPSSPNYSYPYHGAVRTDSGWYAPHMTGSGAAPSSPTATNAAPPPWATSYPPGPPPSGPPSAAQPAWAPPHQNPAAAFDPSPAARAAAIASLASQMSYAGYPYQPNPYYSMSAAPDSAVRESLPIPVASVPPAHAPEAAVSASNRSPSA